MAVSSQTPWIILSILGIWLALLSFVSIRAIRHYRKITQGSESLNLAQILEGLDGKQEKIAKELSQIQSQLLQEQKQSLVHFQKHALIRFNPFEDAGGDQSFVIALLDGANNGVVISSLHARGGTRVYAKAVINAKPASHQFSKEEKEAVEKACQAGRLAARQTEPSSTRSDSAKKINIAD